MKLFDISDVLSVTTGRLVSSRHMEGVHAFMDFLTGDQLFTHQLPRAANESREWLRSQFPNLMDDSPGIPERLVELDRRIGAAGGERARIAQVVAEWVEELRVEFGLPQMVAVYELGSDMHVRIDPIEEARAMFGDSKVIVMSEEDQ